MAKLFANDTIKKSGTGASDKSRKWYITRNWHYLPDLNITIGVVPKCGTNSFRELFKDYRKYTALTAKGRCVFVVRDPVDRFISLWKSKSRDQQTSRLGIVGMSIDELLDFIESEVQIDHHWLPQSVMEAGRATELVPFEDWPSWLEKEGFGTLPHKNKTVGDIELTPEQIRRVLLYYWKDELLYARAKGEV
jgi:hypothetical protein